jgi:hypothetical protein
MKNFMQKDLSDGPLNVKSSERTIVCLTRDLIAIIGNRRAPKSRRVEADEIETDSAQLNCLDD